MPIRNFNMLFVWIFSVIFSIGNIFAQTKEIDSLKLCLGKANADTNKVNIFLQLSDNYFNRNDYKNSFQYSDLALHTAIELSFITGVFKAYMQLGNCYAYQNNLTEAAKNFSAAVEISKKRGSQNEIAETYLQIASDYKFSLHYAEALNYAFKAFKLYEETGNKYGTAKTWVAVARIYSYDGDFAEVENSCNKALSLFESCPQKQQDDVGICYHYIGRSFLFRDDCAKAMKYLSAALKIWQQTGNKYFLNGTLYHLSLVYKKLGQKAAAKGDEITAQKMYRECLVKLQSYVPMPEENSFIELAESNQEIGDIYVLLKRFSLARYHLNKALTYANITRLSDNFRDIYGSFVKLDSAVGNYKLAFLHARLYAAYKDTISEENRSKKAEIFLMQFEFNKREDSLNQEKKIIELNLHDQKKQKYYYWIGLGFLAIVSFFILHNFRNQKKINRLETEAHSKEKTELELQSLKAQMNPHFMFNCINSIDAFIQSNDKYNATLYLNKFAKLIRNVLDSSKQNLVTFSKDIETLKLYIELEELRSENKFTSNLNIDEELMSSDYKVPPLIIQPFVENAIIHGLRNKETNDGILSVNISKTEQQIVYSITDNGIGRTASQKINTRKEKSYGMEMSYERIKLFNKETTASVTITDLYENEKATGTNIQAHLNIV